MEGMREEVDSSITIDLVRFTTQELKAIWNVGFTKENPEWVKWNAPYFNDYHVFKDVALFESNNIAIFLRSNTCRCILVDGQPIGMVSKTWIDETTRWLEIGIVLYDTTWWGKGIATKVLEIWVDTIFKETKDLEHIGMTTWSGNIAMMRVAKKCGFTKEGQIRKVRYYKGVYYDSLKYGILREEWNRKK